MNNFKLNRVLISTVALSVMSFAVVNHSSTNAFAEQPPAIKLDLSKTIKKTLSEQRSGLKVVNRFKRPISVSSTVFAVLRADLVTVHMSLSAQGSDAGDAINSLDRKKDDLINAAKKVGIEIVASTTSSLNVRSNRARFNSNNDGKSFNGTLSVVLTFKAGENVLRDIAKFAGKDVTGVNQLKFSFSNDEWEKQSADLKKRVTEKARASATEKAAEQGKELGTVKRSNINLPRHRNRNQRQQMVKVQATARMTYNLK